MNRSRQEEQRACQPPLCANACGFYGNPTTRNLCSKCYRNALLAEQQQQPTEGHDEKQCQRSSCPRVSPEQQCPPTDDRASSSGLAAHRLTPGSSSISRSIGLGEGDTISSAAASTDTNVSSPRAMTDISSDQPTAAAPQEGGTPPIQANKTRCFKCHKKVGLLGFQCRCSYVFCGAHRHADEHHCTFDYKSFGREQLNKANQRVVAEKLNRI